MNKYLSLYNNMSQNIWYTAKELGVYPATMTAMVRRELVEASSTSPRKYRKVHSKLPQILDLLAQHPCEFFTVSKGEGWQNNFLCMLSRDGSEVLDGWEKYLDINNAIAIEIKKVRYPLQ